MGGEHVARRYADGLTAALEVARTAERSGDVPVGAVILDESGAVVATGVNGRELSGDPTAHAEVVAIRAAAESVGSWHLEGLTLVVTLEPCTMCAGAIVLSRLDRVVYGAVDDKAGAVGSLWDVVRDRRLNHRPEVIGPWDLPEPLTAECSAILRVFFTTHRALGGRRTERARE